MVYIFLALIFYTGLVLVSTAASRNANTNLVAAVNNVVSAIIPILVVIPALSKKAFTGHKFGIWMAVLAGLLVGLFSLALTKSFSENKLGIVTPIVYGGTILLSTIGSYFLFKEKVSVTEGFGLLLVLIGLGVVIYARAVAG
jgi:drug/metabolite transporter (DMT)-like permease